MAQHLIFNILLNKITVGFEVAVWSVLGLYFKFYHRTEFAVQ
jgi:hypothetical protein